MQWSPNQVLWANIMAEFRTASNCMTFDLSNKKGKQKQSVSDSKGPKSDPASWLLEMFIKQSVGMVAENELFSNPMQNLKKIAPFLEFSFSSF